MYKLKYVDLTDQEILKIKEMKIIQCDDKENFMFEKKDDKKWVMPKEAAEKVIQQIFDYYELDVDEIEDKDQKKFIKQNYDRLIKAARLGRLEVKLEKGIQIIQHLRDDDRLITYGEISGSAKVATAGKEATDFYGRIYAVMGVVSKEGEDAIKLLKGVDLSLCEVLGAIFLSA